MLTININRECEITHLVTQMHATRSHDLVATKIHAQKAHVLKAEINSLANDIIHHSDFKHKTATEFLYQKAGINIAQLGGFVGIKEHLLKNQTLTNQDFLRLIKHLHTQIQKINQCLQQERNRDGRSY